MQNIIDRLNGFSPADVNLHVLIRNKKTKEYSILTTEPHESIRRDLINLTTNQIEKMIDKDFVEEEYSPVTQYDSNTYETINAELITTLNEILSLMEGSLSFYNSNSLPNHLQLWAYVIVIPNEMVMFQKIQPRKVLKCGQFLGMIERDNGHFVKLEESVFTFNDEMDCILDLNDLIFNNGKMYIFKKTNFESIFGILDHITEQITASLEQIPDDDILVDINEFTQFCLRDRNKLKKLNQIIENDGFRLLTHENVERLNQSHNLGLEFENDNIKLSPRDTQKVLNLMNEDCVDSSLTENRFVAHHKSQVRRTS